MKKLVIIIAVVLMLTGGIISVLKTMEIGPFASATDEDAAQNDEEGEGDERSTPKREPPRFVDMEPLIITIFQDQKVATTIQITVKLETTGAKNEAAINKLLPRLGDAYLRDLYAFVPRLLRKTERIDVFAIKARMQLVSDKVAGPGVVDGVLVQSVVDTSRPPQPTR
jgi:flagellar basal body-associated protein FliL